MLNGLTKIQIELQTRSVTTKNWSRNNWFPSKKKVMLFGLRKISLKLCRFFKEHNVMILKAFCYSAGPQQFQCQWRNNFVNQKEVFYLSWIRHVLRPGDLKKQDVFSWLIILHKLTGWSVWPTRFGLDHIDLVTTKMKWSQPKWIGQVQM